MRKPLVASFVLAFTLAGAAPAFANPDPAKASQAGAYGLSATGLVPIAPTPVVAVATTETSGPQNQTAADRKVTIELPLAPITVTGVIGAIAEGNRESVIDAQLQNVQDGNNARGFAQTVGLNVLTGPGNIDVLGGLQPTSLLTAQVVAAEAVAKCVNNRAVFDSGSRVVGLLLGGNEVPLVNDLVNTVLSLTGPNGPLSVAVSIQQNETGDLPGGGRFVNALHIKVPLINEDIIVSHAEAKMDTPCAPAPPAQVQPHLATTGGNSWFFDGGAALLVTAFVLMVAVRRLRRQELPSAS